MQVGLSPVPGDDGMRVFGRRSVVAFSLLELLTVLGVIAVLAALSLGSGAQALRERSQRERARADLAVLSASLEAFRRHHGSYPQTDRPEEMFAALSGWRNGSNDLLPARGRRFVEATGLAVEKVAPDLADHQVLDPWGRPYGYAYAPGPLWRAAGCLLYSTGPDGAAGPHPGGRTPGTADADRDNVYANR
jgi:type II secretory pathway pseudopilin PulG